MEALSLMIDPTLTSTQFFWLELAKLVVPVLATLATGVATYLIYLTKRDVGRTRADVAKTRVELADNTAKTEELAENVNGKMAVLTDAIGRAAHAEGMVEVLKEQAPAPVPVIVPVVLPPVGPTQGAPGGRRADDVSTKPTPPDPPPP